MSLEMFNLTLTTSDLVPHRHEETKH